MVIPIHSPQKPWSVLLRLPDLEREQQLPYEFESALDQPEKYRRTRAIRGMLQATEDLSDTDLHAVVSCLLQWAEHLPAHMADRLAESHTHALTQVPGPIALRWTSALQTVAFQNLSMAESERLAEVFPALQSSTDEAEITPEETDAEPPRRSWWQFWAV